MIHESVIIEDGAKIAEKVTIGPFCHIGKDVEIESGCTLEAHVKLGGKLKISKNVKIFSFSVIGYDYSEIEIGENTHIREFVQIGSINDETQEFKKIVVGANNFIMVMHNYLAV